MTPPYTVAIIGAGPAGLSAAAHAAKLGLRHILLEAQAHLADTIYKYQKGKHVMAEPGYLELRSPLGFEAGTRESILNRFDDQIAALGVEVQHGAVVQSIAGAKGRFWIGLESGELVLAEQVVLAIGLQGNLRTLGVPGEQLPKIQYQLDDPRDYGGETIVVVGAGDAAIENALALAANDNRVVLLNRNTEFSRCKEGNLAAIQAGEREQLLAVRYGTSIQRVEAIHAEQLSLEDANRTMLVSVADLSRRQARRGGSPGLRVVLNTPRGEESIDCHRIVARLGAVAPRKLVEGFGVRFSSQDASALPLLSPTYESSVPGLYVVGALGGYPLIKQAMNHGCEAVESICGRTVVPADQPLLEQRFAALLKARPALRSVEGVLAHVARHVPWVQGLSALQLRELMLESQVHLPREAAVVFARNDYSNSFYSIVEGSVRIDGTEDDNAAGAPEVVLPVGAFFGEMGLISGRRRSATVRAGAGCVLVETPARTMLRLLASVEAVRRELDQVALRRAVRKYVAHAVSEDELSALIEGSQIRHFKAGQALFEEGDRPDGLYLIRRGSVMVSRRIGGREVVLSYVPAGHYVGEMALVQDAPRSATVRAAVPTEAIVLMAGQVTELLARNTGLRAEMDQAYLDRVQANQAMGSSQQSGNLISFLLQQGVGEATDVLLIDESLCIRCDNCERACADTHQGSSRLDREAGPTFDNLHVPTSCRHCEHPHCMKDCPPDAIRRSPQGEVYITDACIGCGNCEKNCPYGVIQMAPVAKPRGLGNLAGMWGWLLTGLGQEPGARRGVPAKDKAAGQAVKQAVKCDMCKDLRSGPACVRACPTGAAIRISPERLLEYTGEG